VVVKISFNGIFIVVLFYVFASRFFEKFWILRELWYVLLLG